jgi:hypothetical protein
VLTFHFFGFGLNKQKAVDAYNSKILSKCALQFLIEQRENFNLNGTSPFHINYYNALQNNGLPGSNGYPVNLRKIALINGSSTGKLTNQAGQLVIDFYAANSTPTGPNITNKDWLMPNYNQFGPTSETVIDILGAPFFYHTLTWPNFNPRGCMDILPGVPV